MRKPMRSFWIGFWSAAIGLGLVAGVALAAIRAVTEVFR